MDNTNPKPMPKRSCIITIMFGIKDDKEAIDIKEKIDAALEHIEEKRYNFQINET